MRKNDWDGVQIPLQLPVSHPPSVNPDAPKKEDTEDNKKESPRVIIIDI
jgi:hypothetical protein